MFHPLWPVSRFSLVLFPDDLLLCWFFFGYYDFLIGSFSKWFIKKKRILNILCSVYF